MNILFDVTHPAHLHLFRPTWEVLNAHGHSVYVAARDKDVLVDLLPHCEVQSSVVSSAKGGWIQKLLELGKRDIEILRLAKEHEVDLLVGSTFSIPHVGWLIGKPSIAFSEDDIEYKLDRGWNYRVFGSWICTPDALQDDLGKRHITYPSYHELAYLHPDRFVPDPQVLAALDVEKGESFFILRSVALRAYHDNKAVGLDMEMRRRLVAELSQFGRVFLTTEGELSSDLERYQIRIPAVKMHDALYYASMLVSDSQTMTVEAAVLGTPAIRCNTFVGRCSIIEELEHKYGLTYGFLPTEQEEMLCRITELVHDKRLHEKWQRKRFRMLKDKIDLTPWIVDFLEGFAD